jgi:excisionase family DNA binding protein
MNGPVWAIPQDEFWQRHREAIREELASLLGSLAAPLLSLDETAQLCGCSTRQIRRLRLEGLPTVMVGEAPRFERDAVLAWLRARAGRTTK